MSHEATNWAFKVRGISPTECRVLMNLADCHNPVYGCFPKQEYLADASEIDVRSVRRCLEGLRAKGHVNWVEQREKDRRKANRYSLAFEPGFRPFESAENLGETPESEPDKLSGSSSASTGQGCWVEPDSGGSLNRTQESAIEPVREPVKEPVIEREPVRESAEGVGDRTVDPAEVARNRKAVMKAFDRWYRSWPAKDSSHQTAVDAWMALGYEQQADCIERTPDYIEWCGGAKKISTWAAVYLRERRWEMLPAKTRNEPQPEPVAAFGKGGMAYRFWIVNQPERPHPKAPAVVQQRIDEGGPVGDSEIINRRAAYSWPQLVELDRRILAPLPIRVAPDVAAMGTDFISTDLEGPVGRAWKELFRRMRLPWLPAKPGQSGWPKYVYLPPIDAGADDLDKAVAAAWWIFAERCKGHADAA